MATSLSLAVLSLLYWLSVGLLEAARVSLFAWLILYGVCVACAFTLWARLPARFGAQFWLLAAFYSVLFASIFFGANGALDALNGPNRAKAHVSEQLGGLELWFALCPGAFAVCVASCLRSLLLAARAKKRCSASRSRRASPNLSIERTSSSWLRQPPAAAHVGR